MTQISHSLSESAGSYRINCEKPTRQILFTGLRLEHPIFGYVPFFGDSPPRHQSKFQIWSFFFFEYLGRPVSSRCQVAGSRSPQAYSNVLTRSRYYLLIQYNVSSEFGYRVAVDCLTNLCTELYRVRIDLFLNYSGHDCCHYPRVAVYGDSLWPEKLEGVAPGGSVSPDRHKTSPERFGGCFQSGWNLKISMRSHLRLGLCRSGGTFPHFWSNFHCAKT